MNNMQSLQSETPGNVKQLTVYVNGRAKEVPAKELLSFDEVVALAFGSVQKGPNTVYTVTYRRGEGNKPEGTLVEGESVRPKDGMIFNVTRTDKS